MGMMIFFRVAPPRLACVGVVKTVTMHLDSHGVMQPAHLLRTPGASEADQRGADAAAMRRVICTTR